MSRTDQDETGLDSFFEAARRHRAEPGAEFRERLLADALGAQPSILPGSVRTRRHRRPGWLVALGGWPALTGLVTATVAGVWIGIVQPVAVGDLAFGGYVTDYDFSGLVGDGYAMVLTDG